MAVMSKEYARSVLARTGAGGRDFHSLNSDTVQRLKDFADLVRYREPRGANGSRLRYYHAALERAANRK